MSEDLNEIFQEELRDLVDRLESSLMSLRDDLGNIGLVNEAFRSLHTIKGSGAMFGFADLAGFVHNFETVFDRFRSGEASLTLDIITICLNARDLIPHLVDKKPEHDETIASILRELQAATDQGSAPEIATPAPAPVVQVEMDDSWATLSFTLTGESLRLGSRPHTILNELRGLDARNVKADFTNIPFMEDLDHSVCYVQWSMEIPNYVSDEALNEVFSFHDVQLNVTRAVTASQEPVEPEAVIIAQEIPVVKPAKKAEASQASIGATSGAGEANSIRVGTEKLDTLMDQVGELVIAESRLVEIAKRSGDLELLSVAEHISRLSSNVRHSTMGMRMLPFKSVVARFRRLIMGLSDQLDKQIDFVVSGEDTELDKTMIEKLVDPLVHILRNSMDHGIENHEIRAAAGKVAKGQIKLSAEHSGNEVLIIIEDDGKGLDVSNIRRKAIERGIISADQNVSEEYLMSLIFEPSFSTHDVVSELSGRGVGMDVVKKTIESMRGSIQTESSTGKGTKITLRLPLTLAIVEGMLVEVGGEKYTLPLMSVKEIVDMPADKAIEGKGTDFIDVRSEFVPFLRLRNLVGLPKLETTPQVVIVVSAGGGSVGIVVDRIIGNSQTVIKQMSELHKDIKIISGATILGDGTIALILDVMHLTDQGRKNQKHKQTRISA